MIRIKSEGKFPVDIKINSQWVKNPPRAVGRVISDLRNYARHGKHRIFVKGNLKWLIEVCRGYRYYFQNPIPMLSIFPGLSEGDKLILYKLYKSNRFKNIDELRDLSAWDVCPYCGLRNSVTLDHYLPRRLEDFPHLSFFSLNLIPACGDCQSKKGDYVPAFKQSRVRWVKRKFGRHKVLRYDINSPKNPCLRGRLLNSNRFIHPYFDSKIEIEKIGVSFDFDVRVGPTNFRVVYDSYRKSRMGDLIRFHFNELEVESRLVTPLRNEWDSLFSYLKKGIGYGTRDLATIHRLVVAQAEKVRSKLGLFSMEAKFLDAVAANEDCIEFLRSNLRPPPRNVPKR